MMTDWMVLITASSMRNLRALTTRGSFHYMLLVIVLLFELEYAAPEETCHFPQFLQGAPQDKGGSTWTTRTLWLYLRHEPRWQEKKEITVKNGQIWQRRERRCERSPRRVYKSRYGHCSEQEVVYNRTCISEEGYNTYRVIQYNADRTHRFTCMKFVKRSNNVVQVYEGPLSDTNDEQLCNPDGFRIDVWPWVAHWNKTPSVCPVSGGFSFRTIRRLTNGDLCEDEWRRSSLEIECLRGDGMMFMAPKGSKCNPFLKDGDNQELICWADWENEDFIYMIASVAGRQPTYCLRFPRNQEGEFSVLVYFSVICPSEPDGKPPSGIEYYELIMYRKDPMTCQDEDSQKCEELITSPDICAVDKMLAPHCPKTCGKCFSTITNNLRERRCAFDPNLFGKWVLYDHTGSHDVIIDKDEITLTNLATFQCLQPQKIGKKFMYKTTSIFENGCSTRYTCIQLDRKNNNVLQYRIGTSDREENKMADMCVFRDDPPPLRDTFRSSDFKILILAREFWPSYCGLDGVIAFNGTVNNGRLCQGTMADWDEKACRTRGTLKLRSETCKQLILPLEYQCLGIIQDPAIPLTRLLLTRSMNGDRSFNCWVITSYFDQAEWPSRVMFQMPNTQCSLLTEVDTALKSSSQIFVYLDDKNKHKDCKPDKVNHHSKQTEYKKSTERIYSISNQTKSRDGPGVYMKTMAPKTEPYYTEPPYMNLYSRACIASSRTYIDLVIVCIFISLYFIHRVR